MEEIMANPYYNPEPLGLVIVDTLEAGECYEFDTLVVWRHVDSGRLYWAHDSGCSCPTPFENYHSIEDLEEITAASWPSFESWVRGMVVPATERQDLLRQVGQALRQRGQPR
jgi:hypothetical protein